MNELKFGHRVLAWDNQLEGHDDENVSVKGKFIAHHKKLWYYILPDGKSCPERYANVIIDPDATEFVTGDEVEFRCNGESIWTLEEYGHYDGGYHFDIEGGSWDECRYPQQEKRELPDWVSKISLPEFMLMWQEKRGKI